MKTCVIVTLLSFCVLGVLVAPAGAQAIGPLCVHIAEFDEIAEFFAFPSSGDHWILSGRSLTFGDAYSGSGYLVGSDFVFSLASGLLPGFLEGAVNLDTDQGSGSVTFADTGEIQPLSYAMFGAPCALP